MGFGRSLAPPVLRPVQATGHQLDHSRVHDMNGQLEAESRSPAPSRHESRRLFAQVFHHLPKQLLGHLGRPFPVGVGKSVAARGRRTAKARQRSRVQLQRITQVIESDAVGRQLRAAQAHHMAPGCERARLILRPGCPRNFGDQVLGNKIANLAEDAELGACWVERFIFHPCLVAGSKRRPNTFLTHTEGWL